ncbi:MAG: hypothetical protein RLY86_2410 [Pseudomonadota bacterium]|jgi:hypothetical protein
MSVGLKLRAQDADDLKIVSAMMQDSIIPICDLAWLAAERSFVLVANRFKWEQVDGSKQEEIPTGPTPDVDSPYERTNCALRFSGIDKVSTRGLNLKNRQQMLSLMAIEPGEGTILLHFASGASIRLETAGIDCLLEDVGEPWPTAHRPCHEGLDDVAAE